NGVASFSWQPLAAAWRDVLIRWRAGWRSGWRAQETDPVRSGWLAQAVASGATTTVFLGSEHDDPNDDPLTAILAAQEQCDRPIQLVPILCVWDPAPDVGRGGVGAFLLGGRERPGLLTTLRNLYLPSSKAPVVQAGQPVDLALLLQRTTPADRLSRLRTLLRRFLRRESKVVRGPSLLPYDAMKAVVLENPPMRQFAADEARATGRSPSDVQRALSKEYDQIAAHFSWGVIRFLSWAMRPLWNRVFSGYDIRDEDLDRIRDAARRGAPVLVPCHKSHFDYLLLSWVCFYADIIVPHVVAGINLAIWPVSILLRSCGGFFVKRSFAGERLHPVVFARYLRALLDRGYTVEFFIEGGRTRTGMLLTPKLGVLGMVVDAGYKNPSDQQITLLPVAIAYEQVAEEGAYREELRGAEKEKESMGQLIRARSVLSRRFGRVYLRVGEPVRVRDVLRDVPEWGELDEAARRAHLQRVGDLLVHRIGQVMVVLPTSLVALALLAHHRRALPHADLVARIDRFRAFLRRMGALESASLDHAEAAIAQALDRLAADGLIRGLSADGARYWEVVPEARITLDFHKNQVLHFFAPAAHAAAAIHALGRDHFTFDEIGPGWDVLVHALDREFTFDPSLSRDEQLRGALGALESHGALRAVGDGWEVADAGRIGEILGLLRGLLESYLLVARHAMRQTAPVLESRAFLKDLQANGESWLTAGAITRPEALNQVALKNALTNYAEMGLLPSAGQGRHRVEQQGLAAFVDGLSKAVDA
ncbi:MAG TPA: 1-acyl-sn-glycerol-3-phosphate acyltransferase, partial [Myxococcota bacterium]|nr:1-acyl-sn-glycerol-3-phosphate acyltransferase [Myxococcota bacterium]